MLPFKRVVNMYMLEHNISQAIGQRRAKGIIVYVHCFHLCTYRKHLLISIMAYTACILLQTSRNIGTELASGRDLELE